MKSTSRTAPDTEAEPRRSPTCRTNRGHVGFIAPGTPGNHWGHTGPPARGEVLHRTARHRSSGLLRGFAVTGYITD